MYSIQMPDMDIIFGGFVAKKKARRDDHLEEE